MSIPAKRPGRPVVIVLMGVSGRGKTTMAKMAAGLLTRPVPDAHAARAPVL